MRERHDPAARTQRLVEVLQSLEADESFDLARIPRERSQQVDEVPEHRPEHPARDALALFAGRFAAEADLEVGARAAQRRPVYVPHEIAETRERGQRGRARKNPRHELEASHGEVEEYPLGPAEPTSHGALPSGI
jgi:hypothetical protein